MDFDLDFIFSIVVKYYFHFDILVWDSRSTHLQDYNDDMILVFVFPSDHTEYTLLEEYPAQLLHELPQRTGHHVDDVLVILLEYGPNFSGPGKDTFRLDRATGEPVEAHKSNFLHPVFYYYKTLPTCRYPVVKNYTCRIKVMQITLNGECLNSILEKSCTYKFLAF